MYCLVDKSIIKRKSPHPYRIPLYMFSEHPLDADDSGWRFFGSKKVPDGIINLSNLEKVDFDEFINYQHSLLFKEASCLKHLISGLSTGYEIDFRTSGVAKYNDKDYNLIIPVGLGTGPMGDGIIFFKDMTPAEKMKITSNNIPIIKQTR